MTITLTIAGDTATSVQITSLVRLDTGAEVAGLTLPDPMTDAGGGVWTYTFTAPAAGLDYRYEYLITWPDTSITEEVGTVSDDPIVETYGTRGDIEDIYGTRNTESYAALEGADTAEAIEERIGRARTYAYEWINSKLRAASLTAPATADNFGEFEYLNDIEAERAGAWLYFSRGKQGQVTGADNGDGQMQWHWDNAEKELDRIIAASMDATDEEAGTGVGVFQSIPINRGTTCTGDEFSA